jgi:hypothetical protein
MTAAAVSVRNPTTLQIRIHRPLIAVHNRFREKDNVEPYSDTDGTAMNVHR